MGFEAALSFFIAIFIFGITPGPGIFALLARSLNSGAKSCFMLALGMSVSDCVYLVLACFGLATIATHYSEVFTIIRFLGAAYLLYLGYKMWVSPIEVNFDESAQKSYGSISSFIQGFLISASNPKVILFYIAFLPTFMDLSVLTAADISLAVILTLVALMLGLMLISALASRARLFFRSERAMRRLNKSAGSLMIGAAGFLATSSH